MAKKPTYEELEKRVAELEASNMFFENLPDMQSEEKYREFVEGTDDLVAQVDGEGRLTYINKKAEKVFGLSKDQCIGSYAFDFVHPEDKDRTKVAFGEWIRHRLSSTTFENRQVNQTTGEVFHMLWTINFHYDDAGNLTAVNNIARDITDLKKAEEELAQIFSMSLDMICIADINTATLIKVNPAFTEILGFSEEELLGKTVFDFIHPEDIDLTRTIIEREIQSGNKVINFNNRFRCKDGNYRWLSWVSHPNTEQGVTFAVARDITEWKKNEETLKNNKALLDSTGRMAKVGGWEFDVDTLKLTWTEETCRIHEVPLDFKPSLKEAINFFPPEDRPKLESAIQRAINHGEPYDMEIRFITARGKHLWTRTICKLEIVEGKTVRLKGTFQDITAQKQAEVLAKKERDTAQTYLDIAGVATQAAFVL